MTSAKLHAILVAATIGPWLAACESEAPSPAAPVLDTGYWQASITLPGGNIETGIEISGDGDVYGASLVNGQERVRIDEVSFQDGELVLRFPAFNSEIRAVLTDGGLEGNLTLVKRFGDTQVMPFKATAGGAAVAEDGASARHDLSGRWAVRFHEPDGSDSASIGEFAQRGSRLYGTFLNPNGDHRFLAGHVRGDAFHLSTFDGSHAFIFSGTVSKDGDIVNADFWSGTSWHQTWSAVRNEAVELPDAFSRTWLKPGYDRFEFEFPDENGALVSLDHEKYQDKVVIVTLSGTWCPNCNDEARFLAPFYLEYRDEGLEVITLLFEHFDDAEIVTRQAKAFRSKHDIEYDTLIAGISDKADASRLLPQLSAVLAFPTTIFIDRDGRVREIHTGFSGPGTGEHYDRLRAQFTELVTTLLAEPPDLIESLSGDEVTDES
jgi:peroxiredoxin